MATNISSLRINAPIQKVWDVLTQPDFVKQWQFGSVLSTDWKPGNDIRFTTAWEAEIFEQWGKVIAFEPPFMLQYSLFAPRPDLEDIPENYFTMLYKLLHVDNETLLEIIQQDDRAGAKQEPPQGEENAVLKMLKDVCEA